jgi:HK97 gp10 family phage protein
MARDSSRAKIARPALREAAAEVRKSAKRHAPKETGLLRRAIKSVVRTKRGVVFAIIGPAWGFKKTVNRPSANFGEGGEVDSDPARYAHLVEFGTAHSPPQPFLRPAYDGTPSERIIARRMSEELEKQAKKEAAKG